MKSQPNGANPKQLSISNLINQTQENQNNKVLYIYKKRDHWPQKLQNFSKTNPIWPLPFQSNKPNHTHDHKAITKLKFQRHIKKQQNQLNCAKSQPK